jgi:hypothetical protein
MKAVLDFESFLGKDGEIVVKEVAIVSIGKTYRAVDHFIVQPPYEYELLPQSFKDSNKLLTENRHGLRWNQGYVEYKQLSRILLKTLRRVTSLYTTTRVKAEFLKSLLDRTFLPLEEFNLPDIQTSDNKLTCFHPCHFVPRFYCALKTASSFAQYLEYYNVKMEVTNLCVPDSESCLPTSQQVIATCEINNSPIKMAGQAGEPVSSRGAGVNVPGQC